jgi:hypothetical protein
MKTAGSLNFLNNQNHMKFFKVVDIPIFKYVQYIGDMPRQQPKKRSA